MVIAVASGKGGTGKTTLSTALAECWDGKVHLVDCDVEEPNCHIFFDCESIDKRSVNTYVPDIDESLCTNCGKCAEFCKFNALGVTGKGVMVFSELCHNCGGCRLICPVGAIAEREVTIGCVKSVENGDLKFSQGILNVGVPMSPPVIREVKRDINRRAPLTIIDCPPGTSCPSVAGLSGADFVILVTEPTPFGLHDMKMAVDMVKEMELDFGVVINRSGKRDRDVERFCRDEEVPVLMKILESRSFAEAYSRGEGLLTVKPELKGPLNELLKSIIQRVDRRRA